MLKHVGNVGRSIKKSSAEAAFWLNTVWSEAAIATGIESWFGDNFNTLSNAYTKAMDGSFAGGLQSGEDYVSPTLHRLFEGHSLGDAWDRVREALPDDTATEEFVNYVAALASDMSSKIGLPVATMSPEQFEALSNWAGQWGISTSWLVDSLHFNTAELIGATIPSLAALLCWNDEQTKAFRRLAGSLFVTTAVAANPLSLMVLLVMLAHSYHKAVVLKDRKQWAKSVGAGGLLSGIVLGASAIVAGPVWVGIVVGILLASMTSAQMADDSEGRKFFKHQVMQLIHRFRKKSNWASSNERALVVIP